MYPEESGASLDTSRSGENAGSTTGTPHGKRLHNRLLEPELLTLHGSETATGFIPRGVALSSSARDQRAPISFRRWIRAARASYFVAVDVKVSIELGVVSRLASLRARCAFSRHDHSMSCKSSNVKWQGTSFCFADEVGIYPVCQVFLALSRAAWRRLLSGSRPSTAKLANSPC